MTNDNYIRAGKIKTEIDILERAIAFIEKECLDDGIYKLGLSPYHDHPGHCIQLFIFEDEDNKRLTNRILTTLKNERDLLQEEFEEL